MKQDEYIEKSKKILEELKKDQARDIKLMNKMEYEMQQLKESNEVFKKWFDVFKKIEQFKKNLLITKQIGARSEG